MFRTSLLTITLISLSFFASAQKANDDVMRSIYHYLTYPETEGLSTPYYALSVREDFSCGGQIPALTYTTPISENKRGMFYVNMVPYENNFFIQGKDLLENLITNNVDFTEFKIHTGDIEYTNQKVRKIENPKIANEYLYFLDFDVSVPTEFTIRRRGSVDKVILDTNSSAKSPIVQTFPSNVVFTAAMMGVQKEGYNSEMALMLSFKGYKNYSLNQWRDKVISDFLSPIYSTYKSKYMLYEIVDKSKVISDKNKNGGYDHLVAAATDFNSVFEGVEMDYKAGKHGKHWTPEYQEKLNKSVLVWEAFLTETDFDVLVDTKTISDNYRQKILLNYVQGLILTGQFDKAEEQIAKYLKVKVRAVTAEDLRNLRRTLIYEKTQFENNATSKGWVKI